MGNTPSISAETLKRLRKLAKLATELPNERYSVSVTRLTVLKKMCEEREVALAFAFYMAELAFKKAQRMEVRDSLTDELWMHHLGLMQEAMDLMKRGLDLPDGELSGAFRACYHKLRAKQDEHKDIPYGAVRLVRDRCLLQIEQALRCFWEHEVNRAYWVYQLARDHAEKYEPAYGTGLLPSSAPQVREIVDFWVRYYDLSPEQLTSEQRRSSRKKPSKSPKPTPQKPAERPVWRTRSTVRAEPIALNGTLLHEVATSLPSSSNTRSHILLPAHRHKASLEGEQLSIDTHALTVAQLFFDGVLKAEVPLHVEVGGRALGLFALDSLMLKREPTDLTNDRLVRLHLRQLKEPGVA